MADPLMDASRSTAPGQHVAPRRTRRRRRAARRSSGALLTLLVFGHLPGCAVEPEDPAADDVASERRTAPAFDGPYAAELAQFYGSTDNSFVLAVLGDGVITDAEYAEMTERFRSCLADQSVTFDGFRPDGGYTTSLAPGGADTHEVVAACSRHSGQDSVGALHDIMTANPDNVDATVAIAGCLVDARVVPPSYTAQDYRNDREGRFRDVEQLESELAQVLDACMSDPFGPGAAP
jgi:hypothetical protein